MEYHTVFFDQGPYKRLLNALKNSIKQNTGNDLVIHEIPYEKRRGSKKLTDNSMKLEIWDEIVENSTDDIVLLDCDIVVLKDISHVFEKDFDLAYTRRDESVSIPINGGVVFVRPNEKTKKFFKRWVKVNTEMMGNRRLHYPWAKKYAGINQAAFGYLLENNPGIDMIEVPCEKYNACDPVNWRNVDKAYVLHIKSELQRQCLSAFPRKFVSAVQLWKKYDRQ